MLALQLTVVKSQTLSGFLPVGFPHFKTPYSVQSYKGKRRQALRFTI